MVQESQPTFNPRTYLQLYLEGQYDALSAAFIELLSHFETTLYTEMTPELQYFIDVFIKNFLYLFTQPDYVVGDRHALRFIQLNPVIANLTAMSHQGTTDYYLEILQKQPQNFIKLLTLWNARCTTPVNYDVLLATNATLAARWYSYYIELYLSAQTHPLSRKNLRHHLTKGTDQRLEEFANLTAVALGSTSINHEGDRPIKQRLNQAIRDNSFGQGAQIKTVTSDAKSIAVVTAFWQQGHPVYEGFKAFVSALAPDYKLTLVYLGLNLEQVDQHLFQQVLHLRVIDGALDIEPIRTNDFAIAYFPDVGLSAESILLANIRLAPIQIAGLGHPVSTRGAQIDYIISGAQVEVRSLARKNYDERLVLLPGNGVVYQAPEYTRQHRPNSRTEIIINCPWPGQHLNEPLVKFLAYLHKKATKPLRFRFFPGPALHKNGMTPLRQDLARLLPSTTFEIVLGHNDNDDMAILEAGDFALDAYPFGCPKTVVEHLYLRQPIVTYEGKKWANRISSQLLRQVGLAELIATNANSYVQLALKLIEDTAYREEIGDRLRNVDLEQALFNTEEPAQFKQAITYLQANHDTLQQETFRKPIMMATIPKAKVV